MFGNLSVTDLVMDVPKDWEEILIRICLSLCLMVFPGCNYTSLCSLHPVWVNDAITRKTLQQDSSLSKGNRVLYIYNLVKILCNFPEILCGN